MDFLRRHPNGVPLSEIASLWGAAISRSPTVQCGGGHPLFPEFPYASQCSITLYQSGGFMRTAKRRSDSGAETGCRLSGETT